jgi:hypothetical protein
MSAGAWRGPALAVMAGFTWPIGVYVGAILLMLPRWSEPSSGDEKVSATSPWLFSPATVASSGFLVGAALMCWYVFAHDKQIGDPAYDNLFVPWDRGVNIARNFVTVGSCMDGARGARGI